MHYLLALYMLGQTVSSIKRASDGLGTDALRYDAACYWR